MINTIQVNCTSSTFVDKYHSIANFSKSNIITAGIVHNRTIGTNIYKSILNFKLSELKPDMINSAFLFLFVENISYNGSSLSSIGICGNYEHTNAKDLNWSTFPQGGSTEMLHLTLPKNSTGSYIKINVTAILKKLSEFDINYNFIFAPISATSSMIIKFASCNSNNPPYLKLEINNDNDIVKNTEEQNNDNIINNEESPSQKSNMIFNNTPSDKNSLTTSQNDTINKSNNYELDDIGKNYYPKNNRDNPNNKIVNIPNLFTEISNTLAYHSELLGRLRDSDNNYDFDEMFKSINHKFESFYDEFSNLHKEISLNSSSKDIDNTNTILVNLSEKIDIQSSVVESLKNILSENYPADEMEKISDTFSELYNNLDSLNIILTEIKDSIANNSVSEEIFSLNSLITLLINTVDLQGTELSSIKESINNNSNDKDLNSILDKIDEFNNNTNNLILNINKTLDEQNGGINSLNESFTNFINKVNLENESISSMYDLLNTINDHIQSGFENMSSIPDLTLIQDKIENICNISADNNLMSMNENLISIMEMLDSNIVQIKSSVSSTELYYNSITDSLEKLNIKLSNFENISSKLDLFENNSLTLSQNLSNLHDEIVNLKSIILPITEELNLLKSDFNKIKNTIIESNQSNSQTVNNTSELNSIDNRLSLLSEELQKVIDVISSITIEPLN